MAREIKRRRNKPLEEPRDNIMTRIFDAFRRFNVISRILNYRQLLPVLHRAAEEVRLYARYASVFKFVHLIHVQNASLSAQARRRWSVRTKLFCRSLRSRT